VGCDDEIGVIAAGDRHRDRWGQASTGTTSVDELPDGADVDRVALERLDERLLELDAADGIEDVEQSRGGAPPSQRSCRLA
jgi:hypothetical protein